MSDFEKRLEKRLEKRIKDTPKWQLPFSFYDPFQSFGKEGIRTLLDCSGEDVGTEELWAYGKEAYESLQEKPSEELPKLELIKEYFALEDMLFELLEVAVKRGLLHLIVREATEETSFEDWRKHAEGTDALIVFRNFMQFISETDPAFEKKMEKTLDLDLAYAVCVLVTLDYAALSVVSHDMEALSHYLGKLNDMETVVKSAELLKKQVSQRASNAANVRHKENRGMRKDAIEYYEQHKDEFASRAAATRAIAGIIVPVYERTVDNWLKQHIKAQSARTP